FTVFTYLILTFIPQILSNAILPYIISLLKRLPFFQVILNAIDKLQDSIGGALNEIFKSFGQNDFGSFSLAGFTTDVFTAVVSLMVYIAMFISLSIFMVILMFIIYAIIRHKLKAAKIN